LFQQKRNAQSVKIDLELSPIFQSLAKAPLLSIQLEESEATVQGMLSSLSKEYGEGMTNLLFEKGQNAILSGLMVTVNDKIYTGTALNRQRVQLHGGDKVSLLYFVSGG
jgi:sulfur carrier protein ThiS